ncbi:protein EMSY-LIKE 3-like isoform X2 [Rhodamnia argentea]|uniref:Protein EMSY-LIKE 3-like isoform X2 n=1 Tax=Rhodamnia argentea TaxID=178133 RepID=A0ABM3HGW4_9MYRT|nr:protein EMSY-LIKE 3-like isoform X2 [Rhodamnia argentea]
MDQDMPDSSSTDDDLPPPHRGRFQRGHTAGNGRSTVLGTAPLPRIHDDMENQINNIEQEAYCSILRAFKAQSDAITWEKESLITELRKELRVSDEEHRELLSRVNSEDIIRQIREWRKANGLQPGRPGTSRHIHDPAPSRNLSASHKKLKTTQSVASLSMIAPPPSIPSLQPPRSAFRQGSHTGGRSKKTKPKSTAGAGGRPQGAIRGLSGAFAAKSDSLIGKKVWTRWPDDNNFYEAVITDYNSVEGRHALVYDIDTANETWEWVDLKEISPSDIRWEGNDHGISHREARPGVGQGVKKSTSKGGAIAGLGGGRRTTKAQTRNNLPSLQSGIGRKALGDIELFHTDSLVKKVEKVLGAEQPDAAEIAEAKRALKKQELALVDAISRLEDASDGESGTDTTAKLSTLGLNTLHQEGKQASGHKAQN